jgi:CRISPR-associated protein Csx10
VSELVLTLRQPAQIGDRSREDFVLATMEYLPGSVVRGAFAAAWLARYGVPAKGTAQRAEFIRLFEGGVRYGSLLPDGTQPPSLSVVSHKYEPLEDCGEVEFDRAVTDDVPPRCPNPDCESPLEQRRDLRGQRPRLRRRGSVSIHESGVARRGVLFTRETLPGDLAFAGTVAAGDPALLGTLAALGEVRVGGRRTTHGLATVSIRAGAAPPTAERRADGMLILRLSSPGIFVDPQGRPSREPTPDELERLLGVPARVKRRWTRWQQAGGWHIASGLPKPTELAVAPGSTFLIDAEQPVADQALAELGRHGVGLRRHEGFGDLAPPPELEPGRRVREAEQARLRELLYSVAPLSGVRLNWRDRWPSMQRALTGHAVGDQAATAALRREAADPPDARVGAALEAVLGMTSADAAYVVGELNAR